MGSKSTFGDRSGTITTGGTAQDIVPAGPPTLVRTGFSLDNLSSGDLFINVGAAASLTLPGSILIPSRSLYETPPTSKPQGRVSIIGATTGQAFTYKEW
jgi:hypothetical protein